MGNLVNISMTTATGARADIVVDDPFGRVFTGDSANHGATDQAMLERQAENPEPPAARTGRPAAIEIPSIAALAYRPPANRRQRRDWYRFENAADDSDTVELWIYDEIVEPIVAEFWEFGISALKFVRDLQEHRGKPLAVHINSPGGVVFEALAIYNSLRSHTGDVHVFVDGIAASAASVIAMAGDRITMRPHSMMMIHDPWGVTVGNAADHELQARVLNKLADDLAAVYNDRGDKRVNWRNLMKDETWLSDEDALRYGLADDIDDSPAVQNTFDLSMYRNAPARLASAPAAAGSQPSAAPVAAPTERDVERVLRDAGLSNRDAKTVLSGGWEALHRDGADDTPDEAEDEAPAAATGMVDVEAAARARILELEQLLA